MFIASAPGFNVLLFDVTNFFSVINCLWIFSCLRFRTYPSIDKSLSNSEKKLMKCSCSLGFKNYDKKCTKNLLM